MPNSNAGLNPSLNHSMTEELVELLATDSGQALARALQGMDLSNRFEKLNSQQDQLPDRILDWKRIKEDEALVFERPNSYRCKPKRIQAKHPDSLRICLFGESMAAGFPFAPAFTPALVLEDILRSTNGSLRMRPAAIEVIDLALPNLGPSELLWTVDAASHLSPDVFVFMAGNNWHYGLSVEPTAQPSTRVNFAKQMESGGTAGLVHHFRSQLQKRAQTLLKAMTDCAHSVNAKSVVVIPPANHDWEHRNPPPWLGQGKTAKWFSLFDQAQQALTQGDWQTALETALKMEEIDPNLTGTPQRIKARAHRELGNQSEASRCASQAIDAINWQNITWALPQTPSYVAEEMRVGAKKLNYTCIDLEEIFSKFTSSPFLDFKMFADHCHLSTEGIRVAMSAVAEGVLRTLKETQSSQTDFLSLASEPHLKLVTGGELQAAHWLSQFYPSLESDEKDLKRHLQFALESLNPLDDHLRASLKEFLKLKNLACSPRLNAASQAASAIPGAAATIFSKRLNPLFIEALIQLLRPENPKEIDSILDQLLEDHQKWLKWGVDLTDSPFRDWFWERSPTARQDPNERQGCSFYRALWQDSKLSFLSTAGDAIRIELVARSGSTHERGGILKVNDKWIHPFSLSQDWVKSQITIPNSTLKKGVNRIHLRWPNLCVDEDEAIQQVTQRFRMGVEADLFAVFGEIYSMKLRTELN